MNTDRGKWIIHEELSGSVGKLASFLPKYLLIKVSCEPDRTVASEMSNNIK